MTVGIIMGSKSDWQTMKHAAEMLDQFGVAYETRVVSAHRTPHLWPTMPLAPKNAVYKGSSLERAALRIFRNDRRIDKLASVRRARSISPSVWARLVILHCADAKGIAVGTLAIGEAGAANAGILAAQIIGIHNPEVMSNVEAFRAKQTQSELDNPNPAEE